MKALCVRQPWAWLLFHGKGVENRDWYTAYRGPLVIVASQGMTRAEYEDACQFVRPLDAKLYGRIPYPEELLRGYAIGVVQQTGCIKASDSPWFQGKFGHVYSRAHEFAHPVQLKGRLGIFDWNPELNCGLSNDDMNELQLRARRVEDVRT